MTSASFNYIASQYEAAVDMGLDMHAIRLRLTEHGIRRSPAQVAHDLEYIFEFVGDADSHPAPPAQTLANVDKVKNAMTEKEVTRFNQA